MTCQAVWQPSKGVKKLEGPLVESLHLSFEQWVWKCSHTTRKGDNNSNGSVCHIQDVWYHDIICDNLSVLYDKTKVCWSLKQYSFQ